MRKSEDDICVLRACVRARVCVRGVRACACVRVRAPRAAGGGGVRVGQPEDDAADVGAADEPLTPPPDAALLRLSAKQTNRKRLDSETNQQTARTQLKDANAKQANRRHL